MSTLHANEKTRKQTLFMFCRVLKCLFFFFFCSIFYSKKRILFIFFFKLFIFKIPWLPVHHFSRQIKYSACLSSNGPKSIHANLYIFAVSKYIIYTCVWTCTYKNSSRACCGCLHVTNFLWIVGIILSKKNLAYFFW